MVVLHKYFFFYRNIIRKKHAYVMSNIPILHLDLIKLRKFMETQRSVFLLNHFENESKFSKNVFPFSLHSSHCAFPIINLVMLFNQIFADASFGRVQI